MDAAVAAEPPAESVTTVTRADTVVPGIMVAGFVVPGTADPSIVVAATVCAGTVLGCLVVPGRVVVKVAGAPSSLAGIALPTPLLVHGLGRCMVAVLGFAAGSAL